MHHGFSLVAQTPRLYLLALFLSAFVLIPDSVAAQPAQEAVVRASNIDVNDYFGRSVALQNGRMVVGASKENGPNNAVTAGGAAYVYDRQPDGRWLETGTLRASNAGAIDQFGLAVDMDNDRIVVGAPYEDGAATSAGAAYVYEQQPDGSWQEAGILRASNADGGENLGVSVAIHGDEIIVGAPFEDNPDQLNVGAAYVFERQADGTWQETDILQGSDPDRQEQFGRSVSMDGDHLVVGAQDKLKPDTFSMEVGAAYVFERQADGTWQETDLLRGSDGDGPIDEFGASGSIHGDRLVVGAPADNSEGSVDVGAAYVFERQPDGTWQEKALLRAPLLERMAEFGSSVSIHQDRVVVGARFEDTVDDAGDVILNTGAAYVFERQGDGTWQQAERLRVDNPVDDDAFGQSVAVHRDLLAVGKPARDVYRGDGGSAHVYNFDPNIEPTVAVPLTDQATMEDAPPIVIDLTGTFTDPETPDADLALSLASNNNESLVDATVDNVARNLTLALKPNESGTATITVQAEDEATATVTSSFELAVSNVPDLAITDGSSAGLSLTPDIEPGTDDNLLGLFELSAGTDGVSLEGVTVTNSAAGTAGITSATLYASSDPNLDPATDDELSVLSVNENNAPPAFDFAGFTTGLTRSATYVLVAVDVNTDAPDTPIALTLADNTALEFTGGELASLNGSSATTFSDRPLSTGTTPLPVELAEFSARGTETGVILEWQTLSETGNDRFEIERRIHADAPSLHGKATGRQPRSAGWVQVGTVDGSGTTTTAQQYGFDDTTLPYDAKTLSYRLKQVDVDGTSAYSPAVKVHRAKAHSLELRGTYPNPSRGHAIARLSVPENVTNARLVLYDLLGRQVHALPTPRVGRQKVQIRTENLAPGTYFLRLTGNGQVRTQRVTVIR